MITEKTTLGELSIRLAAFGLRMLAELTSMGSRFVVTLADPNGISSTCYGSTLSEAADSALQEYITAKEATLS